MPRRGKLLSLRAHVRAPAIASLLILLTGISWGQPTPASLHQTDSTQFLWAGANEYRLWFEPARIEPELDAMVEANLKVLRIFLDTHGYEGWEDPPEAYTFENPIGVYHEESLAKVDYLMAECQKRGLKMIIALANSNNPEPYETTFGTVGMYRLPAAIQAYKSRFSHFLNHHNALLDKPWKEINDTVLAWEIQNEPGVPFLKIDTLLLPVDQRHAIIRNFLNELATHLKNLDPDTYVSLGIAGYANYYHSGKSGDDIRTLGNIKDADIYTLHFFGGVLQRWLDDNLSHVRSMGKLLLVEEFGKLRGEGMDSITVFYRNTAGICRENGVPWTFWRMGHRTDNDWSIFEDDSVWKEVVIPQADSIACVRTADRWNVNFDSCRTTVVENEKSDAPQAFQLYQSFPNPVRLSASGKGATTISFHLPRAAPVDLRLYDLSGRELAVLLNGHRPSGAHRINWRIENLPAGLYFCRLRFEEFVLTQKIMIVR